MKNFFLALLLLLSFSLNVNAENSEKEVCFDLLNQEVKKEIQEEIPNKGLINQLPSSYGDFYSQSQHYKEAYDFFLKTKMDEDYFTIDHYSYGEKGGFNLLHSNNVFQLWSSNILLDNITEGALMVASTTKNNSLLYCRSRINVVVNHPDLTLATVKNTDVMLADVEKPFIIESIEYKGKNYKKVLLIRNILDHKGIPLLERNEMFIIPEKNDSNYNVYTLVDTFKRAIDEFTIWKKEALDYMSNPENSDIIYISQQQPMTEVRLGKKPLKNIVPITYNGFLAPNNDADFIRYHVLQDLLSSHQSAAYNMITILNTPIRDYAPLEKAYSIITKDKEASEYSDNSYLNNQLSITVDAFRFMNIARQFNDLEAYKTYAALGVIVSKNKDIQNLSSEINSKLDQEKSRFTKILPRDSVNKANQTNNQITYVVIIGILALLSFVIILRKKPKKKK